MKILEQILQKIKRPDNYTIMCGKHFSLFDRVEEIIRTYMEDDGWNDCVDYLEG